MLYCLTLSIIRYVSRVKWSNPGKGVAPSPTPRCCSYRKGSLQVTLDYGRQLRFELVQNDEIKCRNVLPKRYSFSFYVWCKDIVPVHQIATLTRECPCGLMVKAMDCEIVLSEFVLQSNYYVHFRANALGKGMTPTYPPNYGFNGTPTVLLWEWLWY